MINLFNNIGGFGIEHELLNGCDSELTKALNYILIIYIYIYLSELKNNKSKEKEKENKRKRKR